MTTKKPRKKQRTRVDKVKNLNAVAAEKLKSPMKGQLEIAKKLGMGEGTVNRAIQELDSSGFLKSPDIIEITDTDLEIVKKGQRIINNRLSDPLEILRMRTGEISTIIKESTQRYALFRGNATDPNGGMKDLGEIIRSIQSGEKI